MDLEKLKHSCRKRARSFYNFFVDFKKPRANLSTDLPALNDIKQHSLRRTALNEHLETLFLESLTLKPRLIVELGVARGESTRVFAQVAQLCGAKLVSVDLNDCSRALDWEEWFFIQKDDLEDKLGFIMAKNDGGHKIFYGVYTDVEILMEASKFFGLKLGNTEDKRTNLIDPATTAINGINITTTERDILKRPGKPKSIEGGYSEAVDKPSKDLYYDGMKIYLMEGKIYNL